MVHRLHASRPGSWWRALLLAIVVSALCLLHAVSTARTEAPFGPHFATYEVSFSGRTVIDLGPLGTLQRSGPLPAPLGIDVVVHEIPDDYTAIRQVSATEGLLDDLNAYFQLFASPQDTARIAAIGLVNDIGRRFLIDTVALAALVGVAALLMGRVRGRAVARSAVRRSPWLSLGSVVAVCALLAVVALDVRKDATVAGAEVFDGTPLAGSRVTGRLGGLLETYGDKLIGAYQSNEAFYNRANRNLATAWDQRLSLDMLTVDADTASVVTAEGLDDSIDRGPLEDWVTLVVIADTHCNFSMSPLVTTTVAKANAAVVLHAGDATIDGSAVEQTCVDSVATAIRQETTLVFVGGNHDSATTSDQFESAGAVVLRGKTVDVAGIGLLGDLDPYQTRTGQGTVDAREETPSEYAQRLADLACQEGPDISLIHNPYMARVSLQQGCVPYTISGHLHRRIGPATQGSGVEYVSSSTAGAAHGEVTIGPLRNTAEMTVLRFDPQSRTIVDYRLVTVGTDASATVSEFEPYPVPELVRERLAGEDQEVDQTDDSARRPAAPRVGDVLLAQWTAG